MVSFPSVQSSDRGSLNPPLSSCCISADADVVGYPDLDHLQSGLPYGLLLGTFV